MLLYAFFNHYISSIFEIALRINLLFLNYFSHALEIRVCSRMKRNLKERCVTLHYI